MQVFFYLTRELWTREDGQGMTEYAFIALLVALAVMTALSNFGTALFELYNSIANSFPS